MTLRECHAERSYYYPRLEREMSRIIGRQGLDGFGDKAIKSFCSGALGNLRLDNIEDYNNILHVFQGFLAGATWALALSDQ